MVIVVVRQHAYFRGNNIKVTLKYNNKHFGEVCT